MKVSYIVLMFTFLCSAMFAQSGLEVQYIAGVNIPNYQYDLSVGKADSLLYFYKANANNDSVWVSVFTCNPQGNFSNLSVLHAYPYNSTLNDTLTIIKCEYRYNKIYAHFLINSFLIVMTIDDDGNAMDHLINTNSTSFDFVSDNGSPYCLFDENNVFAVKLYQNKIYRINLLTNEFTTFYVHNVHCHYELNALSDDYLLAISQDTPGEPNLFIDNQYSIHHLSGLNIYGYYPRGKVGSTYYPSTIGTSSFTSMYVFLFVDQDSLCMNLIDTDDNDYVLESDDYIVSLPDDKYICVTKLNADTGELLQHWFVTYSVLNGNREFDTGFPNLYNVPNPRTIFRVNPDCLVALSGPAGSPITFTAIDLVHQQYSTNIISIDSNSLGWVVYPAGNNFYLLNANRLHSFRVAEFQSLEDNLNPAITNLTCNPNPFSNDLKIDFILTQVSSITVSIFDMKGRRVKTLVNNERLSGNLSIYWNGADDIGKGLAAGIYFIRVDTGGMKTIRKVLLLH